MNFPSKIRLSGREVNMPEVKDSQDFSQRLLKNVEASVKASYGPSKKTLIIRYGVAIVFPLVAFAINLLWNSYFQTYNPPLLLYFLAITLTGIYGGFGPTILATSISILLSYMSLGIYPSLPNREISLQMLILAIEGAILGVIAQSRLSAEGERARLLLREHQARQDAERSRDQRDEFIALASHEIKTPLTSIKGFNELLQKKLKNSKNPKVVEYLGYMHEQVDRLTTLVIDFLDTTKIRTGKLEINKSPFAIARVLDKTIQALELDNDKRRIILARCDNVIVLADQTRIEQVLNNLLMNAIKYSLPTKKIILSAIQDKTGLVISIQDFGIGIDESDQKHIFDQYFQSNDPARPTRGLGLGLYISAQIVKKHGGDIWLTSKKGEGSTFFFRLPEIVNNENEQ